MAIKITYTAEDGITFDTANKAKIHDAIKRTGLYLESYKMKDLVIELDKLLLVEFRHDLEKAEQERNIYKDYIAAEAGQQSGKDLDFCNERSIKE